MTTHRQHDGEKIPIRGEYEMKTYYEKDGEQIPKEEISFLFECDMCGDHYDFSGVFGMTPNKHVCRECLSDEVVETLEGDSLHILVHIYLFLP